MSGVKTWDSILSYNCPIVPQSYEVYPLMEGTMTAEGSFNIV